MDENLRSRLEILKPNDKWKEILQKSLFELSRYMDPDNGLIDCLLSDRVLNKRAAENCQIKKTKYQRNNAVLEMVHKRSFHDFIQFCEALYRTEQQHIVEYFLNPAVSLIRRQSAPEAQECRPQDQEDAIAESNIHVGFNWSGHIRRHLSVLIDIIDPDHGLITCLASKRVIPEWVIDKYKGYESRSERVECLLLELMNKCDDHFCKFCDALKETNQEHVVIDYLSPNSLECYRHSLRRSVTCPDMSTEPVPPNWRNLLVRQRSQLISSIDPNSDFVSYLEEKGVMNKRCAERCKETRPEFERTAFILDFLKTRPDKDFVSFCKGLELTDQRHVVDKFLKEDESLGLAVQELQTAPEAGDGDQNMENVCQMNICLPQNPEYPIQEGHPLPDGDVNCRGGCGLGDGGCVPVEVHPTDERTVEAVQEEAVGVTLNLREDTVTCSLAQQQDSGYASQADAKLDDGALPQIENMPVNVPLEPDYGDRPAPVNEVSVQHSTRAFYKENRIRSYAMNKTPRGKCIVFNNQKFHQMRERTGTAVDGAVLRKLFIALGFTVEEINDASAEAIKSKLNDVSRDESLKIDQCLILFFLSHGDFKHGKCFIYGSDDKSFVLEDILSPFAPNNCRFMRGKPKIVYIQACRGEQYDDHFTDEDGPHDEDQREPMLTNSYPDFLVGFPTQAGYRAFRDTEFGTWYINALTRVFMGGAHNTGLNSLMNQVAGVASKWISQTGLSRSSNKTQFAIYTCSFTKDLFFFPGISAQSET